MTNYILNHKDTCGYSTIKSKCEYIPVKDDTFQCINKKWIVSYTKKKLSGNGNMLIEAYCNEHHNK